MLINTKIHILIEYKMYWVFHSTSLFKNTDKKIAPKYIFPFNIEFHKNNKYVSNKMIGLIAINFKTA